MEPPSGTELSHKALQTRQRILETAVRLFATKGYEATTMRDIAAEAECSLGLAYRYFTGKDELVLEVYRQLARQLEEIVAALPNGPLAERFEQAMRSLLLLLEPLRETLGALFGAALNRRSAVSVFGSKAADVRRHSWRTHLMLVQGASDAPRGKRAKELATLLYGMQLGLVLCWLQDASASRQQTEEMLSFMRDTVGMSRPLLLLPPVATVSTRLAGILGPLLGADADSQLP